MFSFYLGVKLYVGLWLAFHGIVNFLPEALSADNVEKRTKVISLMEPLTVIRANSCKETMSSWAFTRQITIHVTPYSLTGIFYLFKLKALT